MSSFGVAICRRSENIDLLPQLHKLRYKVFKGRLDWVVSTTVDMEMDNFDVYDPTYLCVITTAREVIGCARLLRTTGPYMMRDTFPQLLHGAVAPNDPLIWESSRFAVDTERSGEVLPSGLNMATATLLAGMLEWALGKNLRSVATVTDVRMERILRRAGWPLSRYGDPIEIGNTRALAGQVEVSEARLNDVKEKSGITTTVLISDRSSSVEAA